MQFGHFAPVAVLRALAAHVGFNHASAVYGGAGVVGSVGTRRMTGRLSRLLVLMFLLFLRRRCAGLDFAGEINIGFVLTTRLCLLLVGLFQGGVLGGCGGKIGLEFFNDGLDFRRRLGRRFVIRFGFFSLSFGDSGGGIERPLFGLLLI